MKRVTLGAVLRECRRRGISFADDNAMAKKELESAKTRLSEIDPIIRKLDAKTKKCIAIYKQVKPLMERKRWKEADNKVEELYQIANDLYSDYNSLYQRTSRLGNHTHEIAWVYYDML